MSAPISLLDRPRQVKTPACRHCGGVLWDQKGSESGFCCPGCAYVHRLITERGLDAYYRLKDPVTPPADPAVFQPGDYHWLEAAQKAAEEKAPSGTPPELTLGLQGVSCAGCVWLIERLYLRQPGARDIQVSPPLGSVRIRWIAGKFSAGAFAGALQSVGYLLGPWEAGGTAPESRGLVMRVGLCAAFALNVMLFTLPIYFGMRKDFPYAGLFSLLSLAFATLSFLVGGSYFLARAWAALRARTLHLEPTDRARHRRKLRGVPYGWLAGKPQLVYFDFVATFTFLMLVGRWAQTAALESNRRRLLKSFPKPVDLRLAGAEERKIPVDQVRSGMRLLVASGQTVPVDSRMTGGTGLFALDSITGEPEPRLFRPGLKVPGGAVNVGRSDCEMESLQDWGSSLLSQLLQPGERAGVRHVFIEKIVRGYLIGILGAALAAGIFWWLRTGDGVRTGAVVTAVLVVSCPCAIGLAFPLAEEMATVALRRQGVFVRADDLWARLSRVRKIVFDKTGTLTFETPVLLNPEALSSLDPEGRSALLALVRDSNHPVSQCLLEALLSAGPVEALAGTITETVGFGVELGPWALGRPAWRTDEEEGREGPCAEFSRGGVLVSNFRFADSVRPGVRGEMDALRSAGFAVFILSGDRPEKVARMAEELGLAGDHALGGLTPSEKAIWIETHGAGSALMLGDGANDSIAFDRALCRGTPAVHRGVLGGKSDFFYLGRGLQGIRGLLTVDQIRRRTQTAILVFSAAYNLCAVGWALSGSMSPLLAAVLMPASSVLTLALVSLGMRPAFESAR